MKKLLIICGPTATGKTKLGIKLAKKFKGEIISADSRQVYQGMDIATGKDLPVKAKLRNGYYLFDGIKVWLYDLVKPDYPFNVADYLKYAKLVIENILQRKKLPIIVGGTGFYIKGLVEGIESIGVPPNWSLRKELETKAANELFDELIRLDSFRSANMNIADRKNKRRLIRAIEIAQWRMENQLESLKEHPKMDALFVGLIAPYKVLYQKINQRIDQQVKMGAEKEIKKLIDQGFDWNFPSMSAMGYREWRLYFEGKATRDEIITRWKYDEHAYVRRQMTWFKKALRQVQGKWFDISKKGWENGVEKLVNKWYTKTDAKKN